MKRITYKFLLTNIFILVTTIALHAQKIGFLLDSYITDRWYMDKELLSEKVKELGGECLVETAALGGPEEQLELAKKMITEDKVDVLVVVPKDSKKAVAIADFAKEHNVPIVSYDRLILSSKIAVYISFNNKKVGELQAQYAVNKVPEGKYLLINGPTSDNNAVLFKQGQMEVLQPYIKSGKIKIMDDIVLSAWSELEAFMDTQDLFLNKNEAPDVIIAANDAIANGCIESLKSFEELSMPLITGQDADINGLKNILKGDQTMTVYKSIKSLATQAAEVAMQLAKGEEASNTEIFSTAGLEVPAILLDPIVVDKTNYKETVVKDGHVSMSELLNMTK